LGNLIAILFFASVLLFAYFIAKKSTLSFLDLSIGWLVKGFYALCYVYIFSTYYGEGGRIQGDSLNFFEDGRILHEVSDKNPSTYLKILFGIQGNEQTLLQNELGETQIWDAGENGDFMNDNRLMIRINSVIHFFSFGNIYVHVFMLSFLAYIGLIFIYLGFQKFIHAKRLFYYALILLPSIGFWGSGLTKEALMILGMGLFFWSVFKLIHHKFRILNGILLLISILLLLLNKPYAGLIILSVSMVFIAGIFFKWNRRVLAGYTVIILLTTIGLSYTPERINLVDKISYKQRDLSNLAQGGIFFITDSSFCAFDYALLHHFDTLPGNHIRVKQKSSGEYKLFGKSEFKPFEIHPSSQAYDVYLITPPSSSYFKSKMIAYDGLNLLLSIPEVFWNTLVRPLPNDQGGNLKYFAFVQNISLLLFLGIAIIRRKKLSAFENYLIYTLAVSSLIILLIIGWTSPVFGAVVRYKVPADLCLLILIFILYSPRTKSQS
jgi:hypothetical protein